jgi:hypothetical protein
MKRIICASILITILSGASVAQDPGFEYYESKKINTLFGYDRSGGGYGSFTTGYSVIDGRHAVLFGGRICWMPGSSIAVGMGAMGFINEFHYEPALDRDVFLAGGYGGLYLEPVLMPRLPVHVSFPVLFGAGGISYVSKNSQYNRNLIEESTTFLLIEPAAEIELNLTRFFRLALGASYRIPTPFDFGSSDSFSADVESIRTLSYNVTFKFGKF